MGWRRAWPRWLGICSIMLRPGRILLSLLRNRIRNRNNNNNNNNNNRISRSRSRIRI